MKVKAPPGRKKIWARYLLILALLAGVTVASYIALDVWNRIRALDSAQQDHADWVFSQLEIEYLKLDRALDRARSGEADDLANLRKRFDIFYSRTDIAARVRNIGGVGTEIEDLRAVLDTHIPLIESADDRLFGDLDALQETLRQIEGVPREIALASIADAATVSEEERHQIVRLIELLLVIVMLVTIALVVAIIRLSRQAKTLHRTSLESQQNHARLASTLRASLDAVVVIDESGTIRDFNGSAETIFGRARASAIDQNFIDLLIAPHLRDHMHENLAKFRTTGETSYSDTGRHELEMIDRTGRIFPVELSVSLARSADGPVFVSYIRDITDKQQKDREIVQARDEALAAYREKSRFFAMMSHEMRTPLNGVLSAIHLLDDGRLNDEQQKFLDAALTSGDILLGHINDVLSIERSESDTDDQQLQACDMTAVTSGLVGTMEPLARTSGARLHLDQTGLTDRPILTDPRAIQQILVNLLSNAIKFSTDGDITLRASYPTSGTPITYLHLEVMDDGPGIPPEDIDRIFDDFVSLDSSYERRTGGTGLGLGIVRRLVQRLGGDVRCESEPGYGSTFTIRLPVTAPDDAGIQVQAELHETLPEQPKLHLLVVDDNEINRDLLRAMLERLGHTVMLATGGQEAVDLAAADRFDGILMDISMPGLNGIDATQAILSGDGPNRKTPVVAVTAHALPNDRHRFRAAGMSGYLHKPLDTKALRVALGDLISSETPPQTNTDAAYGVLNETQIHELLELLGREKLLERIRTLTRNVEHDLPQLMQAETLAHLQTRSHAMAGMCGMLGAEKMHCLLSQIETACKDGDWKKARQTVDLLPAVWQQTQTAWNQRNL
ncbi:ATP-binding protein [uncultured Roseovarius sp.]|uniref:hybrid sensor histidine kinase/response regulator n=1 Tax=uncultured Roseovarius sp. TaxID=293344 RepID=UPI0026212128|nr:ATP-binding protein [uncultured Roseovarius sp.]